MSDSANFTFIRLKPQSCRLIVYVPTVSKITKPKNTYIERRGIFIIRIPQLHYTSDIPSSGKILLGVKGQRVGIDE